MQFSEEQIMLTLAALTYRGFQNVLTGRFHDDRVREALLDGLDTFAPVQQQWELVWGPATTQHVPLAKFRMLDIFDWSAMYVVRHRTLRNKYAIAIRGTNPIASQDWLFGDLWVGTVVQWPYAPNNASVSTSTALGLVSLQRMRSGFASPDENMEHPVFRELREAFHNIALSGERALKGLVGQTRQARMAHIEQQVARILGHWIESIPGSEAARAHIQQLMSQLVVDPQELRPRLLPKSEQNGDVDLLTFLRSQADNSSLPLEVAVTGHSKGGALAPAVAMWLKDALPSGDSECWDKTRKARVRSYAFAGPTPGNAEFADRMDTILGEDHHHLINTNDIVPHAFHVDDLAQIPQLYGDRTAALAPLVRNLISAVQPLNYRHSTQGIRKFAGSLDANRSFAAELVHQHLDAYLAELNLLSEEMNAFTCFV